MLLVKHDAAVAQVVGAGLGTVIIPPYVAFGILKDGQIVGGYVLNDYNGANIELTAYTPQLMRLGHLRLLAQFIFGHLRCRRISAHAHRKNKLSIKTLEKAGFRYEATRRGFYPQGDAVLFRMKREECRWWNEEPAVSDCA
jgi:RimJ/RimL family protein N-acetyltransferase